MSPSKNGSEIESHFRDKHPVVREIYEELLKSLRQIGPFIEDPKQISIHLVHVTALAGIATRKEHVVLTLKSAHKSTSPRIHRQEQASANRFYNEIRLNSPTDIDKELKAWLRHSYELAGATKRK